MNNPIEWLLMVLALALALQFKPWQMLRGPQLQHPWFGTLVLLPLLWAAQGWTPGNLAIHLSGACLLVLMFGWPLAVVSFVPIGLASSWLVTHGWTMRMHQVAHTLAHQAPVAGSVEWLDAAVVQMVWYGLVPATLALALNALVRRFLPHHVFVYILARGFIGTAIATTLAGLGVLLWRGTPHSTAFVDMVLAYWLLGWGEAFATGMLSAIFVAFRPSWLATYSDQRYLH